MIRTSYLFAIILILTAAAFAQPPARDPLGWFGRADANKNGTIDQSEYSSFAADVFKRLDRNNDAIIDDVERPRPQPPGDGRNGSEGQRPRPDGQRPGMPRQERPEVRGGGAPFFVMESLREPGNVTLAKFESNIAAEFKLIDKNGDGTFTRDEAEARFAEVDARVRANRRPEGPAPLDSQTARFVGAEMRFGDKLVKGAPFSAEIVIEDTRRLYDGTTVTKQIKGAIYRDREGRTRREQPIASIGGFNVVGDDGAPQKLVFINDFVSKQHFFLDPSRKTARRDPIRDDRPEFDQRGPKEGKVESLGTKQIDGVTVTGTRTTFEIPVGELGNDKPIQVVTEKWFSESLDVLVMSRHIDPLSGEHVFKLANIKIGEPAAELFVVPSDFKIERGPRQDGRKNEE